MFVLVYSNQDDDSKRFNTRRYYLPKGIIKNYNVIINGKNFYNKPIDSDTKQYEVIRTLTTEKRDDFTTGCVLDYENIKNHYRLTAADGSRQNELDVDPKSIQQIEFFGQLKDPDDATVANESMFVLTVLEKVRETRVKLTNTKLIKLESEAIKLAQNKRNFEEKELPQELFLTTRKSTKIRNALANNMHLD